MYQAIGNVNMMYGYINQELTKNLGNDDLCKLFDNFESYMKPNYLKYINIFVFIFTSVNNFKDKK